MYEQLEVRESRPVSDGQVRPACSTVKWVWKRGVGDFSPTAHVRLPRVLGWTLKFDRLTGGFLKIDGTRSLVTCDIRLKIIVAGDMAIH